jgi:hypothetical protein
MVLSIAAVLACKREPIASHDAAADFPWANPTQGDAGSAATATLAELRANKLTDGRYSLEAIVMQSMTGGCPPDAICVSPGISVAQSADEPTTLWTYMAAPGAPPRFPTPRRYGLTVEVRGRAVTVVAAELR